MSKQMTMQHIIEIYYSLKTIIDDTQHTIDPLCKFKLLGLMKSVSGYVADFDTVRNELVVKYGSKSEEGHYEIRQDDKDTIQKISQELEPVLKNKLTVDAEPLRPEDIFNKGIPSEYLTGLYELIEA